VVVLPSPGENLSTVLTAATYVRTVGVTLTIAAVLQRAHPLNGWGVTMSYPELWLEYELQLMTELTDLLCTSGVRWHLLTLRSLTADLPPVLRAIDAGIVLVHGCESRRRFSPRRLIIRRETAALARRTSVPVHLVHSDKWTSF
jgi:hypothetical protein